MTREQVYGVGLGLAVVGAANLVPVIGTFGLAPFAALVVGGYVAFRRGRHEGATFGDAVRGSGWAGLGSLLGTAAVLTLAFFAIGAIPAVQEYARMSEPHPEARLPYEMIPVVGAATGALAGLFLGAVNLGLALVGGFVGGALAGASRQATEPVAAR
jgi:hypothetical protein